MDRGSVCKERTKRYRPHVNRIDMLGAGLGSKHRENACSTPDVQHDLVLESAHHPFRLSKAINTPSAHEAAGSRHDGKALQDVHTCVHVLMRLVHTCVHISMRLFLFFETGVSRQAHTFSLSVFPLFLLLLNRRVTTGTHVHLTAAGVSRHARTSI